MLFRLYRQPDTGCKPQSAFVSSDTLVHLLLESLGVFDGGLTVLVLSDSEELSVEVFVEGVTDDDVLLSMSPGWVTVESGEEVDTSISGQSVNGSFQIGVVLFA